MQFEVATSNGQVDAFTRKQYLTFTLDLEVKIAKDVAQYPLHLVTYALAKFEVAVFNGLGDAFPKKYFLWP